LLGWLIRATTRGTPYSVLASSDTTRFTLSSPVAAMTTLHRSRPASSSELISQASASSHSARGTLSTLIDRGFLSMSSTSWPLSRSSRAMERPTAPAPAMATRISAAPLPSCRVPFSPARGGRGRHAWQARPGGPPGRPVPLPRAGHRPPGAPPPARAASPRPARGRRRPRAPAPPPPRAPLPPPPGGAEAPPGGPPPPSRPPPQLLGSVGEQPAQHLVGGPADGGHGRDAEPLVHLGAAGVVD